MANQAKSDRQAKIDKIRKQQKNAEKRSSSLIIGVSAVIALAIIGAAAYPPIKSWWDQRGFADTELAAIGAPASVCGEITTESAEGSGQHIDESQQVTYDTAPPAFGPHWSVLGLAPVPIARQFYSAADRPEIEQLVHNLEHGFTIMWYDESRVDDEALTELRAIARKFEDTTDRRNAFKVVPWTSEDGEPFPDGQSIALTHWSAGGAGETDPASQAGVWQYCEAPSGEAVESFVREYPQLDSPEPSVQL